MATPTYIEARESVALAGPGDARVIVGAEALTAAGYDPAKFHAVVPALGMRGGRINKNGRIYGSPQDVAAHHMALVRRARDGYVGGWKGHELAIEDHDCPVDAIKLLDGGVVAEEDGSVTTNCLVGIQTTSTGNDVFVMWSNGKPTGLSLEGICTAQEHTITKASPYAAMNPGAIGQTIELRQLRVLNKYDVVHDPSFSTYFAAPDGIAATESVVAPGDTPEVQAAAVRLRAAGVVIESTSQETHMDIKDLKALEAAFPELVKQLRTETAALAATEATAAVGQQAAADRERVVALEGANREIVRDLKAAQEALATVSADLARAAIVGDIRKAMESWQGGKPGGHVVAGLVVAQAEKGAFTTAAEATQAADDSLKVAQDVARAMASPVQASAAERAGAAGTVEAAEGTNAPKRPMSALDVFASATPANA